MKIGIDVHGVITDYPEFFSVLTRALIEEEHEVHIITGKSVIDGKIKDKLKLFDIAYTRIFSIVDSEIEKGTEVRHTEEGIWMSEAIWNSAKANYCRAQGIDMMFDDEKDYAKYFEGSRTKFFLVPKAIIKEKNKNPFEDFKLSI